LEGVTLHRLMSRTVLLFACLALVVGLAACGGDNKSSSSSTGGTSSSNGGSTAGNNAAAEAAIKPYIGKPSPFPVTEPLKSVKKGATVAFMDCGTSICGLFWQLLQPASKTMGVKLTRYKAGAAANTVTQAYDSALSAKPDAVIAAAIDVELWKSQLKKFQDANIPVVTTGILGTQKYGIKAAQAAEPSSQLEGKLMADYTAAKFGDAKKIALYDVPELSFTRVVTEAYQAELTKVCPDCSVRVTHVPVATLGTTAPQRIVSDLQANSGTDLAVFSIDELESGLPAALQSAGIKIKTLGNSPSPTQLQYVKEGKETAVLAVDLPVLGWTLLDQAARQMAGQELTGDEAQGVSPLQFLTQPDIKFDPSKGWTGYPDFPQRFAKLWGAGG
jgi:ribose transport system substrate-binding protein